MKELNIDLGTTGLTVTASVYLLGVVKAAGIACAEIGVTGKYSGDFTATPNTAGVYQVAFFVGAETVSRGGGQIVWDGSAEVLQTGDAFARIGAAGAGLTAFGDTRIANLDVAVSTRATPAQVNTEADAAIADAALATAANLAALAGYVDTEVVAIKAKTDNLPSDPADQSLVIAATDAIVAAIADKTGYRLSAAGVNDVLRTALTEGYAADGAAVTVEQVLHMIWSMLCDKAIVGATLTTKKLDGAATAMTFTLAPSGTAPTSQVRAS